ncbi:MAG: ABC transporter permease [Chloroflexi bacterium]|nr:ABC transporter permease [Chloroflexota bacterium]
MRSRELALGLAMLLGLWQGAAMLVRSSILPVPGEVFLALASGLTGSLGWHILVSCWRMAAGTGLALLVGVPLGLLLGQSAGLRRWADPFIYVTYPVPKVVLLPIVLLFLGIGDASKIALIFLILLYQILVVVKDAAAGIRPELLLSVRSLGAGPWQLLRYVYLPACLPATITALRLSVGTAIAVLYIAESFATRSGLGYYIMDSWQSLSYQQMYSAVVAMSLVGLALYLGLDALEQRTCRWVKAGNA